MGENTRFKIENARFETCVFKTRVLRKSRVFKTRCRALLFPNGSKAVQPLEYPVQNQSPGRGQVDPNKVFSKHGLLQLRKKTRLGIEQVDPPKAFSKHSTTSIGPRRLLAKRLTGFLLCSGTKRFANHFFGQPACFRNAFSKHSVLELRFCPSKVPARAWYSSAYTVSSSVGNPPQIANYYGDGQLLRRCVFSTAGSFR